MADSDDALLPGTDVGGYVIGDVLGRGGMGVVYAATHPVIGKRAAIKVLRPELSRDRDAVDRFVNEARAVNEIGHPNIVDIFAFGALADGRSYYVMDLLAGETLRARLARGPLHVSEVASILDETSSALIAAHAKGIVHRDLKPDNIFMVSIPGRWPEARLLDWGLAKLAPRLPGKRRTLAGQVMGTPVYMSPEQARGSEVDHRTDIYALGVVAYELLAGAVPFRKTSSLDTLIAHQEDPVPPLRGRAPAVPEELAQLIEAMLAKETYNRPTLKAVRAVLKRLRGTKIPTMTAAGLVIAPGALDPLPAHGGAPAAAAEPVLSQLRTNQQVAASPLAARASAPGPAFYPTTVPGYSVPALQEMARGSAPPSASDPAPLSAPPTLPGEPSIGPSIGPSISPAATLVDEPMVVPAAEAPVVAAPPVAAPAVAAPAVAAPVEDEPLPARAPSRAWLVVAVLAVLAAAAGIAIVLYR